MENNYLLTRKFRFIIFLLTALIIVSTATSMCYSSVTVKKAERKLSYDIRRLNSDMTVSDLRPPLYTVKEYQGQIGIWNSSGELSEILPVKVEHLPQKDKNLLLEGFNVYSMKEFSSVIEDYTG